MIILYHDGIQAIDYENTETSNIGVCPESNIQKCLYALSVKYKNTLLIWCHQQLKEEINKEELSTIFHHSLILASYSSSGKYVISKEIGFVDQHCFVNVKKDVCYPTWLMSSDIGGVHTNVLVKSKAFIHKKQSFDLFLCSFAKLHMPKGLLCYSAPNLLKKTSHKIVEVNREKAPIILFQFVKRHYKVQWMFILLLNQFIYKRKFALDSFFMGMLIGKQLKSAIDFSDIRIKSTKIAIDRASFKVDVLIPTLGRREHLYNVLKDLSKQTLVPEKVIIVEQNGDENSRSDLNFIHDEVWPFVIDHTFIHQLGACNARNIALSKVTGNWVFFADDDIRFKEDLLERAYDRISKFGTDCIVMSCLQKGEVSKNKIVTQCEHFGSGTSIIKANLLRGLCFKIEHEFGYGEDNDFGMQLRNIGSEILNTPDLTMLHLKAPIGGFRHQFEPEWNKELVQPKPSPTVMAYNLKHLTKEQLQGYKTLLFIKFYQKQSIKNPIVYSKQFKQRWQASVKWANKMMKDEF